MTDPMEGPMVSRRLHEITDDLLRLEDALLDSGGEWTPEVEALAASLELDLERKVDGYAALISEWEADAAKWKAEEERVAAHRRARENAAARLKARLCDELVRMGREKVETPRFKVAVQRAAPRVEVTGRVDDLPAQYVRTIPEKREADKVALAAALKQCEGGVLCIVLDGDAQLEVAKLVPGNPYIRIR